MGAGNLAKILVAMLILYFDVKMYQTRLAAGLRPDSLEEHSALSETLTAICGQGMEHP